MVGVTEHGYKMNNVIYSGKNLLFVNSSERINREGCHENVRFLAFRLTLDGQN